MAENNPSAKPAAVRDAAVKSAVRAFEIVELLDAARRPLRLRDFADGLGAPTSSIAELLKSLSERGYLAFETRSKTYLPTQRVAALGSWVPSSLLEGGEVAELMRRLNEGSGEMIVLGTVNDIHAQYCDVLRSTRPIQVVAEVGARRLLIRSGIGWALLGHESDEAIERIYRRTVQLHPAERRGWALQDLLEVVNTVRELGCVFSRDVVHSGAGAIAGLLPTTWCGRPLAVAIAGPTERLAAGERSLSDMLRAEMARLARHVRKSSTTRTAPRP